MQHRFIILVCLLSINVTAYSMHVSWFNKLKPVVARMTSSAYNCGSALAKASGYIGSSIRKHKVVASIAAVIGLATLAYKTKQSWGPKLLHYAIKKGAGFATVQKFLKAGVDPNVIVDGEPLLHAAVRSGNAEIVQLLCGADVNKVDSLRRTPLHIAVGEGDGAMVGILVRAGADINALDINNNTPQNLAVLGGNAGMVYVLCLAGADLEFNPNLLLQAVEQNKPEIVRILLQAYATMKSQGYFDNRGLDYAILRSNAERILCCALLHDQTEIVDIFMQDGIDLIDVAAASHTMDEGGLLHCAVKAGRADRVEILLNKGANINVVNKKGETPLHVAIYKGYKNIVDILLRAGANPNVPNVSQRGITPLHLAISSRNTEVVQSLCEAGADLEALYSGCTPLSYAVMDGDPGIVRILLQRDTNLEALTSHHSGYTPLHTAVEEGKQEIVGMLLEAGANKNSITRAGDTALALTTNQEIIDSFNSVSVKAESVSKLIKNGNMDEIRQLIANHLPILPVDTCGQIPLAYAIKGYNSQCPSEWDKIVRLLFKAAGIRRSAQARNADGQSLLHIAADQGNIRIAAVLLHYGAEVNARDNKGNTPLHLASSAAMSRLLLQNGAATALGVENVAGKVPFSAKIGLWQPWFRKWVEEDQSIPALFTGNA